MKKVIIITLTLMCSIWSFAQGNDTEASFPGGNEALSKMIYENLRYPRECFERDIQGKVIAKFQVLEDGSIEEVSIVSSPHELMSNVVINIIKKFPKWVPATKNGKIVKSEVTLPVSFKLGGKAKKDRKSPKKPASVECAQKAETIETPAANSHEPEWYGAQALAWQKIVDENPQDQWAWRNLFCATLYYDEFCHNLESLKDESQTAVILRKMENTIPDSYALNLSKSRYSMSNDTEEMRHRYVERAVELMPDDAYAGDVNWLACRMWMNGPDDTKARELFNKSYKQNFYPSNILYYNWNMLQSMQPNAIYFANGDNAVAPMKMLQEALGIREDVTIIPLSFLNVEDFRKALFAKLNINPLDTNMEEYRQKYGEDWQIHLDADRIMRIIKQSKRPTYFFTDMLLWTALDKDSIYNEGLLLKYSDKKYDNFAVAMHNATDVYHLEYLAEPKLVYNSWETSDRLDANYVSLLSNLVYKLRVAGKKDEATRLYNILDACIKRCNIDPRAKADIEETLEMWNKKK